MAVANRVDRVLSRVLTVCALAAVGLLIEARFRTPPPAPGSEASVERVDDWERRFAGSAVPIGDSGAVEVIVFTDFQCPFCARLDSSLAELELRRPGTLRRSIVHYPLPGNEQAFPAAVAFECAARSGRERAMHKLLYEEQRSRRLALGSRISLASAAGVTDPEVFERCVADTTSHRRILEGIRIGSELKIRGTPTVIVGGWLVQPPTPISVEAALDAVLAGKVPQPLRNQQ